MEEGEGDEEMKGRLLTRSGGEAKNMEENMMIIEREETEYEGQKGGTRRRRRRRHLRAWFGR